MEVVHAKDFTYASFQVVISRVQQAALDKANARVPCPEHQLELLNSKKKKGKQGSLGLQWGALMLLLYIYDMLAFWRLKTILTKEI